MCVCVREREFVLHMCERECVLSALCVYCECVFVQSCV